MNAAALDVFRAGHLPVTGEALALPLIEERRQRARRRPRVRRDLPPDRAPAPAALRRRAAHRRRLGRRRRDGRDRPRRTASRSSRRRRASLMLKEERHRRILELLGCEGRVVATDLQRGSASPATRCAATSTSWPRRATSSACTAARSRARRSRTTLRGARRPGVDGKIAVARAAADAARARPDGDRRRRQHRAALRRAHPAGPHAARSSRTARRSPPRSAPGARS